MRLSLFASELRKGRYCYDQVEALNLATQSLRSSPGKRPHLAFLDIKAAYDSVPRGELWHRMNSLEFPAPLVGVLSALFDHNSVQLLVGGKRSSAFGLPECLALFFTQSTC